jgi:5-bromo-4-chloroindolyl phosphate hydrolysis protein
LTNDCVLTEFFAINEIHSSQRWYRSPLKRQAQEDISAKPAKLIRKELNNQRDALETISVTDFRYIRNNINRARLQLVPKLPRSAEEVQIFLNTANLKTSKEEPFLLCNKLSENIVVCVFYHTCIVQ